MDKDKMMRTNVLIEHVREYDGYVDHYYKKIYRQFEKYIEQDGRVLDTQIFDDMQSFFPGIFSAIKGIGKMQAVWNMIANMNPYVRIAAVLLAITATLMMIVKRVNAMREQFGISARTTFFPTS